MPNIQTKQSRQSQLLNLIYTGRFNKESILALSDEELVETCKVMNVRTTEFVRDFSHKSDTSIWKMTVASYLSLAQNLEKALVEGTITEETSIFTSNDGFVSPEKEIPICRKEMESNLITHVARIRNKQLQKLQRKQEREASRREEEAKTPPTVVINGKTYVLQP